MIKLDLFFTWLYIHFLRLYPVDFYAQYGEEMVEIFRLRLQDASRYKTWLAISEIVALVPAIARQHLSHQYANRPLSTWLMIAVLATPAIVATGILFFRSISIFYLPGKTWVVFAFICAVLVLLGWQGGTRWMVLALPTMGYMVSIGVRQFFYSSADAPGFGWPLEARYALPFVLTAGVVIGYSLAKRAGTVDVRSWLLCLLAAPMCGLVAGQISALIHGAFDQNLSLVDLYRGYFRGMWITPGALSIVFLLALPMAYRYGSKAALLMIGYLFAESIGLAATLWMEYYQRMAAGLFLLTFFVVIPVWLLRSTSQQQERRRTLLAIAGSYGAYVTLRIISGTEFFVYGRIPPVINAEFLAFRTAEMLQTLLLVAVALSFFVRLSERVRPTTSAGNIETIQSSTVS